MGGVVSQIGTALGDALLMAWEVLVGARPRLRHLRDRPGLGAAGARGVGHVRRRRSAGALAAVWNVVAGILIAVASFVCSVGNVPLAAVLWSGGISFGGVLAFLFAVGTRFAARITALLFLAMAAAALIVEAVFDRLGLVPTSRPDRAQVFGSVGLDYKLVLNVLGLIVFAALFGLTMRRGAKDPTCGMTVDRTQALRLDEPGHTHYFCSAECRDRFRVSRT